MWPHRHKRAGKFVHIVSSAKEVLSCTNIYIYSCIFIHGSIVFIKLFIKEYPPRWHPLNALPTRQITFQNHHHGVEQISFLQACYFHKRGKKFVQQRNSIVMGCPCVCASILKSTHRLDESDRNQEEWRFLLALILVYLLDKEGREMTAEKNTKTIK